jgi:hypothetical protein
VAATNNAATRSAGKPFSSATNFSASEDSAAAIRTTLPGSMSSKPTDALSQL